MESLKVPKGGSANKTSIPVAIRFNANEESVEDVTKPCDSLSSSPIHGNSDDSSWRKDFLQGTFFSRKRSGSTENVAAHTSSPSGSLPTANESQSVGTWKTIKSRVSQAMEDIKSPKTDSVKTELNGDDSDADSATINSSISDDFNEAAVFHSATVPISQPQSRAINTESESELDPDSETVTDSRKSFGGKKQSTAHTILSKIGKTKDDCRSAGKSVLRRRKRRSKSPARSKDIEIESGVEITEEMSLSAVASDVNNDGAEKSTNDDREILADSVPTATDAAVPPNSNADTDSTANTKSLFRHAFNHRGIVFVALAALSGWIFNIPPFVQGVLACLCCIILFSKFCETLIAFIDQRLSSSLNGGGDANGSAICAPERGSFAIPNYDAMPICRVPPVEEHKQLKMYSGWMNQINNYDPTNYHISMTRSVFVKLDGSKLTLSSTNARVPKRSMWNEQPIDRKSITFTQRSCYDLTGAHIEMCPKGLARKRYFSRKYPIQLIIKKIASSSEPQDDPKSNGESESSPTKDYRVDTKRVSSLIHQSSNESVTATDDKSISNDLGSAIMLSDLQILQDRLDAAERTSEHQSVPCGEDIRILLFARCDREKEDWYRRFTAASVGAVVDQEFQFPDMVMVNDDDVAAAVKAAALANQERDSIESIDGRTTPPDGVVPNAVVSSKSDSESADCVKCSESSFEGLLLTSCAARGPVDYVRFMTRFQKACNLRSIPVIRAYPSETPNKKNRRERKQEDELWKGIDQSLYLGPSGSVVWANVLVGRILFSCLNDAQLLEHIQEFLQKKLSSIRLPNFMEEVQIAQVNLGDTPPLIHRVSQPMLDERGTWIDADVTYEGLVHMTITTKLNLLRLKRQQHHHGMDSVSKQSPTPSVSSMPEKFCSSGDAIYDSNAESSGASSSESDSPTQTNAENLAEQQSFGQGSSKKFLRIVDRITASNLFQSATEIPYIQKAMENMNTKIRLRVELKGLVARCVLNIPPPPSDRIWVGFRGPPRLWISATPAVGDHTFDWSIVTNAIESKLCDEVSKYLVYPNMVDMIAPFLGHSTYRE